MRLNKNHEQDGLQAWQDSGLSYNQDVEYKGKKYKAVEIGYGMLFKGKVVIENSEEKLTVNISNLKKEIELTKGVAK